MNTCSTCFHRAGEPVEAGWKTPEGVVPTYFECKRAAHDGGYEYKPGQQMLVIDGSGYKAVLCVELTFGCNQWEAKRETQA